MGNKTPQGVAFFSIRKRILVFAVFSTLVPALLFGWVSYYKTHELLLNHAAQEFQEALDRNNQEVDDWLKQMLEDLSVFSRSFGLVENLTLHLDPSVTKNHETNGPSLPPGEQIHEFLQLVQTQVPHYRSLRVLDTAGNMVSQYPEYGISVDRYGDWANPLQPNSVIISAHRSGDDSSTIGLVLGVPIASSSQAELGVLIAEIPLMRLSGVLTTPVDSDAEVILVQNNGEILLSNLDLEYGSKPAFALKGRTSDPDLPKELRRYRNYRGWDVIGLSTPMTRLPWHLVIEKPYQIIFQDVDRLRNYSLLLTLVLLSGFGLLAFIVSQSILLPLKRLTQAASAVAKGDLNTRLRAERRDELGLAMNIFNDMVERLRDNRDELRRISDTDSLTGLYNKKRIMEALDLQFERYRRSKSEFSLLMVDVDHFKRINDEKGHLAGDAALQQIGQILRSVLRSIDVAGRYGGEEFLIILEQTGAQQALDTAERIRLISEQSELVFGEERIDFTLSIGVATLVGGQEETPNSLIQRADRGLYRAKNSGRNQVMSGDQPEPGRGSFALIVMDAGNVR